MQINSQLLESIQQKVELSCQLDQWQVRGERGRIAVGHGLEARRRRSDVRRVVTARMLGTDRRGAYR